MEKKHLIINLINSGISLLIIIVSIVLKIKENSFHSVTTKAIIRYRYFEEVLIEPYLKLILIVIIYDIGLYLINFLLKKFFYDIDSENNTENLRQKSMKENKLSNILVEFFFMVMIKGLGLGFGVFYLICLCREINRILNIGDITNEQVDVLEQTMTTVIFNLIFVNLSILYQFVFFGIRLCEIRTNNKSENIPNLKNIKKNKKDDIIHDNINDEMKDDSNDDIKNGDKDERQINEEPNGNILPDE